VPRASKIHVISYAAIGERVRKLRQERGLTQTELAVSLGTTQTAISEVERGNRGLTVQQVVKLGRELHATPDQILGEPRRNGKEDEDGGAKLMRRVRRIQKLSASKQRAVIKILDGFLQAHAQPEA